MFLVSCAMDCFALLALIPDEEPAGGARKRKRSSISQATGFAPRNRASTRHRTVSAPSDSMNIADLLRLLPSRGRKEIKKRKLAGARDRTTGAAQQQIVQVQRFNKSGRATRHDALMQTDGNVCKVKRGIDVETLGSGCHPASRFLARWCQGFCRRYVRH